MTCHSVSPEPFLTSDQCVTWHPGPRDWESGFGNDFYLLGGVWNLCFTPSRQNDSICQQEIVHLQAAVEHIQKGAEGLRHNVKCHLSPLKRHTAGSLPLQCLLREELWKDVHLTSLGFPPLSLRTGFSVLWKKDGYLLWRPAGMEGDVQTFLQQILQLQSPAPQWDSMTKTITSYIWRGDPIGRKLEIEICEVHLQEHIPGGRRCCDVERYSAEYELAAKMFTVVLICLQDADRSQSGEIHRSGISCSGHLIDKLGWDHRSTINTKHHFGGIHIPRGILVFLCKTSCRLAQN